MAYNQEFLKFLNNLLLNRHQEAVYFLEKYPLRNINIPLKVVLEMANKRVLYSLENSREKDHSNATHDNSLKIIYETNCHFKIVSKYMGNRKWEDASLWGLFVP